MKNDLHILATLLAVLITIGAKAQDSKAYADEKTPLSHTLEAKNPAEAWKEIEKAADRFPPSSHSETSGSWPAGDPWTKYAESWVIAAADKAREFYVKFPNDTNSLAAQEKELNLLYQAFDEMYSTNLFPRIFTRANLIVRNTHFDKTKRFNICYFIFMFTFLNKNLLPANIDAGVELQENARIAERDFQDLGDVSLYPWLARDWQAPIY